MKTLLSKSGILLAIVLFVSACVGSDPDVEQAKLELKNGEYAKAIESLDKAIETNKANVQAHSLKGNVLSEQAKSIANPEERMQIYEQMVASFETAKSIYDTTNQKPQSELINLQLSNMWANEHNSGVKLVAIEGTPTPDALKKAEGHLHNATVIQPDSIISYEILAEVYYMDNNLPKAIEYMNKSIDKQEKPEVNRFLRLAAFYDASGNPEGVIELLNRAKGVHPESIEITQSLANAYLQKGDTDNALATVKTLIDAEPENAQYRLVYGTQIYTTTETITTELESNFELISVLKKDIKATKDKKKAAALKAELDSLNTVDSNLKTKIDELTDEALLHLNKVIELRADDATANYTIGVILQNKAAGIFKERDNTDDNKKASELDTKAKETLKMALPYYEKATEIKPDEKDYWMTLFRVYTTLGMTDKAQVAMEKAGI
ncbi:tetratricopeptide repeat protein [bacterium]|nr:MAG: tetratricopeptide repeat protein [bacterium]